MINQPIKPRPMAQCTFLYAKSKFVSLLTILIFTLVQCAPKSEDVVEEVPDDITEIVLAEPAPDGIYDPPAVRTFPSSPATINKWVLDGDNNMIRAHAWDIWQSITTQTPEGIPVWETWYSGHEIFEMAARDREGAPLRDFEFPSQHFHNSATADIPSDPAGRVTSFNRFSRSVGQFIWNNKLNMKETLDSINTYFNASSTPVVNREVQTSADSVDPGSVVLKPVFQFISGTEVTALPYWAGVSVETTNDVTNPEPHTWQQCVCIDPTAKLKPGSTYKISCNGQPAKEWPVVSLDDFYSILISEEEAANFSEFAESSSDDVGKNNQTDSASVAEMVKAGDYALLVAMHVTGKEIVRWTWQTFWWSPFPQNPIFGKDRPSQIGSPWRNYNMRTAYYMVSPPYTRKGGEPLISYNPYLETNLSGKVNSRTTPGQKIQWYGVFSNCMSCHRIANYPGSEYVPDGYIDPADTALFTGNSKTDFLWSVPSRAQ